MEKKEYDKDSLYISFRNSMVVALSIAACLAFSFFIAPWGSSVTNTDIYIEQPILMEYRSASLMAKEIDDAITNKNYEIAIDRINDALAVSTEKIASMEEQGEIIDEEQLYEKEFETAYIYQLRWMRIYALVCLEKYNEAICDLEPFVTQEGEHQEEAKALLNKLKNKK